jgi:hypothetical protein
MQPWCRCLLYLGRPANIDSHQSNSEWGCFTQLPPTGGRPSIRPSYMSGRTTLDIKEAPVVLSDTSYAAADWNPTCRSPVPFQPPSLPEARLDAEQCAESMKASNDCYRMQNTRVCAPIEPWYGVAVLSVPGLSSFIAFGGRAAIEQISDLAACKQMIPPDTAWRFQYHRELEPEVLVSRDGPDRAFPCLCHKVTAFKLLAVWQVFSLSC